MGLDITAYSKMEFVIAYADSDEESEGQYLYTPEGCESRLDGPEGLYSQDSEMMRFHAGSYGGYNAWRKTLCQTGLGVTPETVWENDADFVGKPFYELINYSDCEGAFGPTVSAKLAKDFEEKRDSVHKLLAYMPQVDSLRFSRLYDEWEAAFKYAAQGGAVILH